MAKHHSQACNESQLQKLPDLFVGAKDTSVIQAEALFTEFTVEHNLPLSVSDHAAQLFRKCFQIRQLRRSMDVGEWIMNTLAAADAKQLASAMKTGIIIANDGSNDINVACAYFLLLL